MLFRLLAQLLPCVFAVTPISAQACLITASASLRVASVALASQWVAMPCLSASMQYRGLSPHVNVMPELSLLCHSGSFVRNARANHAHLSIAYPLPFFALPCRPQLRSYHRLCLTYIAVSSLPLQSLRIFPLPPLSVALHRLCALLSQCRCFSCRSSPSQNCSFLARAALLFASPMPCHAARFPFPAPWLKANPKRLNPDQIPSHRTALLSTAPSCQCQPSRRFALPAPLYALPSRCLDK